MSSYAESVAKARSVQSITLTDGEKELMEKLFANPSLWPESTKYWIADWASQNMTLPISQVQGFDRYRALCGAQATLSSGSISTSMTIVTWDGQAFDTDNFWDPGTPKRITIPVGFGGVYIVTFQASASATSVTAQVQKNTETPNTNIVVDGRGGSAAVVVLNEADYLTAFWQIDTGSAGGETPTFSVIRMPGPPGSG